MATNLITLAETDTSDIPAFKKELQSSFEIAFIEEFAPITNSSILCEDDPDRSINASNAVVLSIFYIGQNISNVVANVNIC